VYRKTQGQSMSPIAWTSGLDRVRRLPSTAVFDDRKTASTKNHPSKSALRVMQRASNHRKRAYLVRRRDIAFILSTRIRAQFKMIDI
jgi:hypothetical protein